MSVQLSMTHKSTIANSKCCLEYYVRLNETLVISPGISPIAGEEFSEGYLREELTEVIVAKDPGRLDGGYGWVVVE